MQNIQELSLNELEIKRRVVKSKLTRFINHVNDKVDLSNLTQDVVEVLSVRISKDESLYDQFDEVQTRIELVDQVTPSEIHSQDRESFENSYFDIMGRVKGALNRFISPNDESADRMSNGDQDDIRSKHSGSDSGHTSVRVKLPTIPLPTFDGTTEKWLYFKDEFLELVHNNEALSDTQRLHYLRAALKEAAAEVIQSVAISAESYNHAWALLNERYENKKLMANNYVSKILALPNIAKESRDELRNLLDDLTKNLTALNILGQKTEEWNLLLIHIIGNKLDHVTRREWEETNLNDKEFPTLEQFTAFLKTRCQLLESIHPPKSRETERQNLGKSKLTTKMHLSTTNSRNCPNCKGSHFIYTCNDFLKLAVTERERLVKRLRLCLNCLGFNHMANKCKGGSCRHCKQRHNSLLCPSQEPMSKSQENGPNSSESPVVTGHSVSATSSTSSYIILSTAMVKIKDKFGNIHECRALLDSCSQSNYITQIFCDKLQLSTIKQEIRIEGINNTTSTINKGTTIKIQSRLNNFQTSLFCLVTPQITHNLPAFPLNRSEIPIPPQIPLADPTFDKVGSIDILIGGGIFWDLTSVGQIRLGRNKPKLQKTVLGWIVGGPTQTTTLFTMHNTNCHLNLNNYQLQNELVKFWEIEEGFQHKGKARSVDEQFCEDHFKANTTRNGDGRFIVHLPLKSDRSILGDSKSMATKRFFALEKKLNKNSDLKAQYKEFIDEYINLGHMSKIQGDDSSTSTFFLPHHAVLKQDSITSKIRVVFDASAKSTSDFSLNDIQAIGPTIQDELFSILIRFRKHTIVVTADVEKMYRQILVAEKDRALQRIVWRDDPNDILDTYELNTVTYGTASAPYLATRCLQETAHQHINKFPVAASVILSDFYVDDLITGADTPEQVIKISNEVLEILQSGGFQLRKWVSNDQTVIRSISAVTPDIPYMSIAHDKNTKTLGLIWGPAQDTFTFSIKDTSTNKNKITKRIILASIARIFDPLGIIGPVITVAKIILQKLWQIKLAWDESVPIEMHNLWKTFESKLHFLNSIHIPRHVLLINANLIEIHGFSDASENAYGAAIYMRSLDNFGNCKVSLLCSKGRIAPLKTTSIPKLELCGALLLSRLMSQIKSALKIFASKERYWCDSTITLSWINGFPGQWKTFVANRVAEIQALTNKTDWYYINTKDNPADLISRGVNPDTLQHETKWWEGPEWLKNSESTWPHSHVEPPEHLPEIRKSSQSSFISVLSDDTIFKRFSSWNKLVRVTAYVLRFCFNSTRTAADRMLEPLSVIELNQSREKLIRLAQQHAFGRELHDLNQGRTVHIKSKLICLSPIMDDKGLIRVGGRLGHAKIAWTKKHPVIVPNKHPIADLIMREEHIRLLHAGPQTCLASLRERYWPRGGRNLARKITKQCVQCFKVNPIPAKHTMGELPASRITPSRPFSVTGIDYAGPLFIRDKKGRGFKRIKAFVCLFICFSTKAIHLEVVSDLTTEAFIAALRRFVSRRGKCAQIYCDNATNFVGAKNELSELLKCLRSGQTQISDALSKEGIQWHFIPPRSPHFGGIWEANIKSAKQHLKRVVANACLTFEELCTVLCQIEACLNSRPLHPMSSNPNDPSPLTPAHFLVGESLAAIPDPDVTQIHESKLSKFQRLQQISQNFWKRWSRDYLTELQTRTKWRQQYHHLLREDSIVIIKEDNLPPLKWSLGRVLQEHTGADGIIRVATVKTARGVVKRSVTKLCVLPN